MRLTFLSLYAATWLTTTAVTLVARPSNLHPRVDTESKFPDGFNAQTCRPDLANVILKTSPATSDTAPLPASAPKPAIARRVLPQSDLHQICQQISYRPFTGADYAHSYNGYTLDVDTSLMQPGQYIIIISGDKILRGLSIAAYEPNSSRPPPATMDDVVRNDPSTHLVHHFRIASPALIHFRILFWWPDTRGEIALFQLGPAAS